MFVALEREQDALREAELQKAEDEGDAGAIADAQAALERDQQETAAAEAVAAEERRKAEKARIAREQEESKQAIQDEINAALTEEIPFIKVRTRVIQRDDPCHAWIHHCTPRLVPTTAHHTRAGRNLSTRLL